jgi:hypothetical protein
MTSLSIIDTPDMTCLQRVAYVTFLNEKFLEVFYTPTTNEYILYYNSRWFSMWDENIFYTLSRFLREKPNQLVATDILLFDKNMLPAKMYSDIHTNIYDCEWSDFACENLFLDFNVFPLQSEQ